MPKLVFRIIFLGWLVVAPTNAIGMTLSDNLIPFFKSECRNEALRQTVIMIDQDNLIRGSAELTDTIIGSSGVSGILGRSSMEDGEEFHILVFRSSAPKKYFDYYLNGCAIGKDSRSASQGRDSEDLANDRFIEQTYRIRAALTALNERAKSSRQKQDNNDAYSMVRFASDALIRNTTKSTRLFIFGNVLLKNEKNPPADVLNGNLLNHPPLELKKTTVHIVGVDPSMLRQTENFGKYQNFWDKLVEESKGWLATFDFAYRDGTKVADNFPPGLPKIIRAEGLIGPGDRLMETSAYAELEMRLRNDRITRLVDWLSIFDGKQNFVFPLSGSMFCVDAVCSYDGEILRDHPYASGPQKKDKIRLVIHSEGAYGAIYHDNSGKDVKFGLMVAQ